MNAITVVIPTYNGTGYLAAALESVFAQSRPAMEVIVVDDASTDGTAALANEVATRAPVPVRVIRLPNNTGGPAGPLNHGVGVASGEYIAVLDQDDQWVPRALEREAGLLDEYPDMPFAFGLCARSSDQSRYYIRRVVEELEKYAVPGTTGVIPGERVRALLVQHDQFIAGFPGFVFRKSALSLVGGLDQSLRIAADLDVLLRLCGCGCVGFVNDVVYVRYDHDANLSRDVYTMDLESVHVRCRHFARMPSKAIARGDLLKDCLGAAYGARQARQYDSAWKCMRLAWHVGPWSPRLLPCGAKLLAHQALARLTGFTASLPSAAKPSKRASGPIDG